jgi:Polyketide cyclase / dehydrase and lipid transport
MGTLEASWSVDIAAPRERCYEIAADIEGAPKWQGTLESVEVLERDGEGRALVVNTTSDATVKKVKSRLRFSYQPPGGITWEQEKGEVK